MGPGIDAVKDYSLKRKLQLGQVAPDVIVVKPKPINGARRCPSSHEQLGRANVVQARRSWFNPGSFQLFFFSPWHKVVGKN